MKRYITQDIFVRAHPIRIRMTHLEQAEPCAYNMDYTHDTLTNLAQCVIIIPVIVLQKD